MLATYLPGLEIRSHLCLSLPNAALCLNVFLVNNLQCVGGFEVFLIIQFFKIYNLDERKILLKNCQCYDDEIFATMKKELYEWKQ